MFLMSRIRFLSPVIFLLSLALVALIGYADVSIHADVSLYIFYSLPIILAAWYSGTMGGVVVAVLSGLMWFAIDWKEHQEEYFLLLFWNAIVRGTFFVIVSLLVSGLRSSYEREHEYAQKDFLTGLENRRAFFERASAERKRSLRMHSNFIVAFIDLDRFKDVNDHFGHSAGDEVLKKVAATLRRNTRDSDIIARLGGDEFGMILVTSEHGELVALKKVHEKLIEEMKNSHWNVTFSIGVCVYKNPQESIDQMITAADRLMYQAKQSGKNRMEIAIYPSGTRESIQRLSA
jgi:diguanylate cyclase (GGDEF)-like protein